VVTIARPSGRGSGFFVSSPPDQGAASESDCVRATGSENHSRIPRYAPFPQTALLLEPVSLSVFVAVLAEIVDASLPLLDILSSGRRPFLVAASAPELRDRIGARCGLARRVVARELGGLEAHGFIKLGKLRNRRLRLEVQPGAFGWPDDDFERRRIAGAGRLERRYAPVPLALVGRYTPAETAILVRVLVAAGVGLFERVGAGERIVVHIAERELAAEAHVSPRTVRRALDRLEADGMVARTSLGREGIAVELQPALLNPAANPQGNDSAPRTIPTGDPVKEDISDPALMHARSALPEREENSSEVAARGVDRLRYGAIYGALVGLAAVSSITTLSLRARARRAALTLALAGADPDHVAVVGATSTRQVSSLPLETVANRVLDEIRNVKVREAAEAQFRAPEEPGPECGLCDGLSHLIANGIAIGCPHDLERVQSWAVARRWSHVGSPSGKVILERDVEVSRPEAMSPQPEELFPPPDSTARAEEDERRALNTAGANLLLVVLARVREQQQRLNSA
jgi:hypothetical protein